MHNVSFLGQFVPLTVQVEGVSHDVVGRPLYHSRVYVIVTAERNPALVGQLAMPRWSVHAEQKAIKTGGRLAFRADAVTYMVSKSLYELDRLLSYVDERYETNEIPRLTLALNLCYAIHSVVLGIRKENAQELSNQLESLVDSVAEIIGLRVRNEDKGKAVERIIKVRQGTDSLNRVNSSASCLRLLTAVGGLIQRENQVANIAQVYAARRQATRLVLVTLETQVLVVENFLNQTLTHWNIICSRRRELTQWQLQQFASVLATIPVKPFRETFRHVARECTEASQDISSGGFHQAKRILEKSLASLQLRKLRVQLEAVHFRIASTVHNANMRKQRPQVAQEALTELRPLIEELSAINTLGMVDFSSSSVLATFANVQSALGAGNCKEAAEHFRLALRAI